MTIAQHTFNILFPFFSTLWTGLTILFRYFLARLHQLKIVLVIILIATAFWMGVKIYTQLVSLIDSKINALNSTVPNGISSTLDILAKANYCLPVSEMLALLAVYVSCWGMCMFIKFVISMYRNLPFKNA